MARKANKANKAKKEPQYAPPHTGEVVCYYPNSTLVKYRYTLKGGRFDGTYIENYSNGRVHKIIDYKDGGYCGRHEVYGLHGFHFHKKMYNGDGKLMWEEVE